MGFAVVAPGRKDGAAEHMIRLGANSLGFGTNSFILWPSSSRVWPCLCLKGNASITDLTASFRLGKRLSLRPVFGTRLGRWLSFPALTVMVPSLLRVFKPAGGLLDLMAAPGTPAIVLRIEGVFARCWPAAPRMKHDGFPTVKRDTPT